MQLHAYIELIIKRQKKIMQQQHLEQDRDSNAFAPSKLKWSMRNFLHASLSLGQPCLCARSSVVMAIRASLMQLQSMLAQINFSLSMAYPRSPRRRLLSLPTLAPPHHHPPRLHRHRHAPSTSPFTPASSTSPSSSLRFAHAAPVLPPCREATPTPQGHAEKEKARRVGMLPSPAATSCRRLAHPRSTAFTHPSTRLGDHTASPVHPETSNQQVCLPTQMLLR